MTRVCVLPAVLLSLLAAPRGLAGQAPTMGPVAPLSVGETFTLNSRVLNEVRRINVYVPPGYAEAPAVRMPVLYMPDGGMAEDFLHVAGLVQVSVGNGTMRPFVLVGIENTERRRDLTGPTENAEDKKIAPRVGGSAAFRTFIRTELMPAVRSRYRTTAETAIVGESLAGLFVVETLVKDPTLFDAYLAFDPSLWWNNHELVTSVPAFLKTNQTLAKEVYLASSQDDISAFTTAFAEALKAGAGPQLKWHFTPMPAERHATIYHPAALQAFRTVFRPITGAARSPARASVSGSQGQRPPGNPSLRLLNRPEPVHRHGQPLHRHLGDDL